MNVKHQLKRQLRDVEAALAPIIARLTGEGTKPQLRKAQNGSIGVVHLAIRAPGNSEIAECFAARIGGELAQLGFSAEHETYPIPGHPDEVGLVFQMIVKTQTSAR